MVKDKVFKSLLIPLLGLLLPLAAGAFSFRGLPLHTVLFSLVFFVFVSHLIWQGSVLIFRRIRNRKRLRKNIGQRLGLLLSATVFYGVAVVVLAIAVWQLLVLHRLGWPVVFNTAGYTAIAVVIVTLIYECLFLQAEVDLDERVMQQLDNERQQAESSVLRNELDPHFLFNCLNALSYLVRNDADKAYQFVHKLSNVFKYLLLNKQKSFVSLAEELAYLDDYVFLLRVRFDESIQVEKSVNGIAKDTLLLPCTLQALVENAIKHNFFSEKEPLVISIAMDKEYITVTNPLKPKPYKASSTKTGLHNLRSRYRFVMNRAILVQKTCDTFLVRIPFEQKALAAEP